MGSIIDFIVGIFQFLIFIGIVLAIIAFFGYNKLRTLSEEIRESWSNIGIVGKKQASLINQLIDVVKGYQESEKLVVLKVSEDMTSAAQLAQMQHQSGMVLSAVGGMAQKFPELKSDAQYQRLIDSIQSCEAQLEVARQNYNGTVKIYNTNRSSIPHVFYASSIGFNNAPYLEFDGTSIINDVNAVKSFSSDQDGEHLKKILGNAGNTLKIAGNKMLDGTKVLAETAQEKLKQIQDSPSTIDFKSLEGEDLICPSCQKTVFAGNKFCSSCGEKVIL